MATIEKSVTVSKELTELAEGVGKFLKVLKDESSDGFDVTDLSAVLASAMTDLMPALEGVTLISDELTQDKKAFVNAAALAGAEVLNAVL